MDFGYVENGRYYVDIENESTGDVEVQIVSERVTVGNAAGEGRKFGERLAKRGVFSLMASSSWDFAVEYGVPEEAARKFDDARRAAMVDAKAWRS